MSKKIITLVLTLFTATNLLSNQLEDLNETQQMKDTIEIASILFSSEKGAVEIENGTIYSFGSAIEFFGNLPVG